ncbi:restriction endonuclease subunit S [Flavobacterium sp. '19STA2R22 D10 B1']|uniref:restriction endonuclease subunit S n=1 Tax=Flavobacterium aerium TaxID=3037261 RepID=UPI00278BDEBD|nr:restriction endonuclease subunit S [Flavobacterium sp. '19STA2R22 D10 B1']
MQLLQHFETLTLHPKNAQEIKGLILQLAIQGKLTANWRTENPNIEPASELIKKIKKEKNQLIKDKLIKKGKSIQKIGKDEKYIDIPNNWEWVRIIEIGNIFNGDSINKTVKAAKYEGLDEGYPYLGTKDINYGFEVLNYDNGVKIPFNESKFKIAHKNTALICSEGGSAGKKCGITTEDICFGNKLYALEQYGDIESLYILSIYKTPIFFEVFQSKMTGIIGGISINSFTEIPIPLPTLEEQKEIVRVVETLFKEVEQLEQLTKERIALKEQYVASALHQLTSNNAKTEWDYLQQHFKTFFTEKSTVKKLRETILQLAVQGKLTVDWRKNNPKTENAKELLKCIQKEKAQVIKDKKIKKESPLPAITKEEIPYELPLGWVWCRLQDLVNVGTGSTPATSNTSYYGGTIPWYTSSATNDLFAKEAEKLITEKALLETNCKVFPKGTLIIAMYGQGKTRGQISEIVIPGATNQAIAAMVFYDTSIEFKEYIKYFFRKIYEEIRLLAEGGAQPNLNVGKIKNTVLPLPPLEEQKAIVEKVNNLMSLCDGLEQEIQQSQELNEQLMKSVLREVFDVKKGIKE